MDGVRTAKVVTAKLNIEPTLFTLGQEPFKILRDVFSKEFAETYEQGEDDKRTAWAIVDNKIISFHGIDFAVGKLGRIGSKRLSQYKKEAHKFDELQIRDLVFATAHFVLRIDTERLMFDEVYYISVQQFTEAFAEILARADSRLGAVSAMPDIQPQEYSEEFKRLKVIQKVRLEFVAPNAGGAFIDAAANMRSLLVVDTGAGRAVVECESRKKEGLRRQNDVVRVAATMPVITPQYGSVVVKGFADENLSMPMTLRSVDKAKRRLEVLPRKDSDAIWARFMELLSRKE